MKITQISFSISLPQQLFFSNNFNIFLIGFLMALSVVTQSVCFMVAVKRQNAKTLLPTIQE